MRKAITTHELYCDFCGKKTKDLAEPYRVILRDSDGRETVMVVMVTATASDKQLDLCQSCANKALSCLAGRLPNG